MPESKSGIACVESMKSDEGGKAMKKIAAVLSLIAMLAFSISSNAQSDNSILTVSGKIGKTNTADGKSYKFSFADLQKVGTVEITSTTRYVGNAKFSGTKIKDILKAVQIPADATAVSVVAIDGYQQTIPIADFEKWDVIVAHTQNGQRLTVEKKGPLWIMYPTDKHPKELLNDATTSKLVWALTGLVVK